MEITAWEKVKLARMLGRPTGLDYIQRIINNFIELHGDRCFGDDPAIVGGIGFLNDIPITVIAQQKGRNTKENIKRNFAMPHPEGYRKSLRLMKQAEKFKRPILCFIDTPGAFCGIEAEERGQAEAIAHNLFEMIMIKVPIISIFIGEGGSGGAIALGVADKIYMLEHSIYSILSPEGFASILWRDSSKAKEASDVMKLTSKDLKDFGVVDDIIKEPDGGAHMDIDKMAADIKDIVYNDLTFLLTQDTMTLLDNRYNKFRVMGQ